MLKRMPLYGSTRPVDALLCWRQSGHLVLDPPFQRGDVWGTKRRRNLIRSMLLNVPIPSIIINDHMKADWPDDNFDIVVIDGKQRITSVLMFLEDKLYVPSEWFGDDFGDCLFSELPIVCQRRFRNCVMQFAEGALKTIEEEIEVFELVNFGGVPQGESDED